LSTQALVDGLWVMGWPSAQIDGARPLAPGMKCVGRAVTLNFVPARPDIAQDKPAGGASPEYEAFELCGPKEVKMTSSVLSRVLILTCDLILILIPSHQCSLGLVSFHFRFLLARASHILKRLHGRTVGSGHVQCRSLGERRW
jgi:hypothetical protein